MPTNTEQGEVQIHPLHAEMQYSRNPGWGGIDTFNDERFVAPYMAHDTLNWTNRRTANVDSNGILATRLGFSRDPKYEYPSGAKDSASTYGPTRLLHKFYPGAAVEADQWITQKGQVLRLVQKASGAGATKFENWDGTAWNDIAVNDSADAAVTLVGSNDDPLGVDIFPQYLEVGLPTPRFVWGDPINGVIVYDGATPAAKVDIPKNSDSSANITGCAWFDELDDRLFCAGNVVDASESNVLYYSVPGDPTDFSLVNGGGSSVVYSADARSGDSAPRYITGLAAFHGMMMVFTEDMRYMISGAGTVNEESREFPGEGAFNGKCIVKYRDKLYWWGKDGAFCWNGGETEKISDPIWSKRGNLALISTFLRSFSYVFKDQWVTTVRYKDAIAAGLVSDAASWQGADNRNVTNKYYNWVYDFKSRQWYVTDIPMVAAFSSQASTDFGKLFFANPVDTGTNVFYCYSYGHDDEDDARVYADDVNGTAGARTGTAIVSTWETGKWDLGSYTCKDFRRIHTELEVNSPTKMTSSSITANIKYRLNDDSSYTSVTWTRNTATPYNAFGYRTETQSNTSGHYIQHRWSVSGTRQAVVKRVLIEAKDLGVMQNES